MKTPAPISERFWRFVSPEPNTGCWLWTGAVDRKGYGKIGRGSGTSGWVKASRVAWELFHGPIPAGLFVCHHCDVPGCVNAEAHLFLGTCADNLRDASKKRRLSPQTHPERYRGKGKPKPWLVTPPKPCVECGRLYKPMRKGRCGACAQRLYVAGLARCAS